MEIRKKVLQEDVPALLTMIATYVIIGFSALVHGLLGLGFSMPATLLLTLFSDVRGAVVMLGQYFKTL